MKTLPLVLSALFTLRASSEDSSLSSEGETALRKNSRIAFGSCHKNRKATVPSIWETMLEKDGDDLQAFVWTGDAMYPSSRDPQTGKKRYGPAPPNEIRSAFEEMKVNETIGYTQLLAKPNLSVYGTWDDHDFGGNDMGEEMSDKSDRQAVFWDFLGYRPHDRDGMYHSISLEEGRIKLILLDTRWFREEHCIPSLAPKVPMGNAFACGTRWMTAGFNLSEISWMWGMEGCEKAGVLGEDQWKWLEEELSSSSAELNIIVSSIQVWTTNPAMESWGQFPSEQERLWNLLRDHYAAKQAAGPVIILSGDVHHAEVLGQEGYLEVTSSGMTHHCGQPTLYGHLCRPLLTTFDTNRHAQDEFFVGLNYGILEVDWLSRVATVRVKDAQGETVLQVQQPLDLKGATLPAYSELARTWDGHLLQWVKWLILGYLLASLAHQGLGLLG